MIVNKVSRSCVFLWVMGVYFLTIKCIYFVLYGSVLTLTVEKGNIEDGNSAFTVITSRYNSLAVAHQ